MDFKCRQCGKCCSNLLPLSEQDIKIIKSRKNLKENRRLFEKNWNAVCPFLNTHNKCDIYEDRPDICRHYTCYAFDNKIYSDKFIEIMKNRKYKLVDMREKFFGK